MSGQQQTTPVVVMAPAFEPAELGGGPIRTLKALLDSAPRHFSVTLVTSSRDLDGRPLRLWDEQGVPRLRVTYSDQRNLQTHLRSLLEALRSQADFVYINGFFSAGFSILPQLLNAVLGRRPVLLAPRGEMSPAALAIRRFKKRVFLGVYRVLRLERRVTWHASSGREERDIIEMWGAGTRVIVREDETLLPSAASTAGPRLPGPLRVSFVGRMVKNKGVHVLLEALADVEHPIELDVIGPPEDAGYAKACRQLAARLPSQHRVRFLGMVPPASVRASIGRTDLFALPTETENFGHAIAESLSMSKPVLLPDTTPWTPVIASGGGVVVPSLQPADWASVLETIGGEDAAALERRSRDAADAYEKWRLAEKGEHVFLAFAAQLGATRDRSIERGTEP